MDPILIAVVAPAVLCLVVGFFGLVAMDRQDMHFEKQFGIKVKP